MMKEKLCCILTLIVLLLNSSIMLVISEAVDAIEENIEASQEEERIKALLEINLTKYENFDTMTENGESGSKGVLVQFNLKTGIEFAEGEEYKPIEKTGINIDLPWIGEYKPSIVEVITKSTQATNGENVANYEYHSSTGILTINAENTTDYKENVKEARDEYEVICIYRSECYTDTNEERDIQIRANVEEILKDENSTRVATREEEEYKVTEKIGNIISVENETDDVYNGYITANAINSENQYETQYNEIAKIEVSNKDIAQKIEVRENSEVALYKQTSIDKNEVLKVLGENGSIDILDDNNEVIKTINKDTETDENGKIKVDYENKTQNLIFQIKNIEKEGTIEIENTRVIGADAQITDNNIPTSISIKGINVKTIEEKDENGEAIKNENGEVLTKEEEEVKYERQEEHNVELKQAVSNIETKLDEETLVNNVKNNVLLTITLKTDKPEYSLFKNPAISIEMPEEVEELSIDRPELMYNNKIFKITESRVDKNENGNKVVYLQLEGEQTRYEESSVVEGTNIVVPLSIQLSKNLEDKVGLFKFTYTNENTGTTENKDMEVTLLNKVVTITPTIPTSSDNTNKNDNSGEVTNNTYEDNGIKVEIIQKVGDTEVPNNGTLYEEQIVRQIVKITNTSSTTKSVNITANIPDEMKYVKLNVGGYFYNEEYNYYYKKHIYQYEEVGTNTVEINAENIKPGETYEEYFEIKVGDLPDDQEETTTTITYTTKVNNKTLEDIEIQDVIKQAEISVSLGELMRNGRRDWQFWIDVTNLTDKELKDVKLVFEASPAIEISEVGFLNTDVNIGIISGNKWSYTIDTIEPNEKVQRIIINGEAINADENETNTYEMNGNCIVYGDNINTYHSNKTENSGPIEAMKVTMTSDKENQKLKWDDEITYTINIENVGRTWGAIATYTTINVKDVIPRELQPIEATYNRYTINTEYVKDVEDEEIDRKVETYTEENKTIDLSYLMIPDGYDEEDAPNINLDLAIPEGKAVTIVVKAKVKMLLENAEITNTSVVTGKFIKTKTASLTNEVLKYDYVEPSDEPDKPVNPDDPDQPVNPDNPTNPDQPQEEKISISGVAWIDENENGKRESNERFCSNVQVMLYDYGNSKYIRENGEIKKVTTDSNGKYQFDNLSKSQYIAIFLFDTNMYTVTVYRNAEAIDSRNSDAIMKNVNINGEKTVAGVTDVLTANSNLANIDIGLIEEKDFDLEIQKYVNKITVQTSKGTKSYTYDNKQFAKVEVHSKEINGATVIIEYKMVVTNKGEVAGKAVQIIDALPDGMKFRSELNKDWYENSGKLYTTSLSNQTIGVGESKEVTLILTKELNNNNVGQITNTVEIGISSNDKATEDIKSENNTSKADVIVGVSTGLAKWLGITFTIIGILVIALVLIIKNKKLLKTMTFILVLGVCVFGSGQQVFGLSLIGINTNQYGVDARDDSGRGGYVCNDPGSNFCDDAWHDVTGTSVLSTSGRVYGEWSGNGDEGLSISDGTNHDNVTFTQNGNGNRVGPFKFNSSHSTDSKSATVYYVNNKEQSGSFNFNDFDWGSEFYINVGTDVVQITKIEASGSYDYSRTRGYSETQTLVYYTTANAGQSHGIWKNGYVSNRCFNGTQSFTNTETETGTEEETGTVSNSATISGPWTATCNLEVKKVDDDNNDIVLPNVSFKISQNEEDKRYLQIKDGNDNLISSITTTQIDLSGGKASGDYLDNNPTKAVINGVTYNVSFGGDINSATTITTTTGKLYITGLRCGKYQFVETNNQNYGYTKMVAPSLNGFLALRDNYRNITNQKQTGNLYIKKIDDRNENKVLPNVEFVLKSSLNSQYIKVKATGDSVTTDSDGWATRIVGRAVIDDTNNITTNPTISYTTNINDATKFVTNSKGEIKICNLLTSSNGSDVIKYHLEEIRNPNYGYIADEDKNNNHGVTFDRNAPDGWVTIARKNVGEAGNIDTTEYLSTTVKNHQDYIRLEGSVWEEVAQSKANLLNNIYNNEANAKDALIEGINVHLCKKGNNTPITTRKTDSNGGYCFGTIKTNGGYTNEDYWTAENGNVLIDELGSYYIEFEYDGLKFTSVEAAWNYANNNDWNTSKATETPSGRGDRKDRTSVNEDFTEITYNQARNSQGTGTYKLEYELSDHVSTYIDRWKYEYKNIGGNQNGNRLKVTYDYDKENYYEIIASTETSGFSLEGKYKGAFEASGAESITGINLGIYRREQPDLAIKSDINSVDIKVEDFVNTYTYEKRKDYENQNENDPNYDATMDGFGVDVKFGDKYTTRYSNRGLNMYTRRVYESDLALYNKTFDTNKDLMQVYVTYRMRITNQSVQLTSKVNELVNYYDSRYTIDSSWIDNKGNVTQIGANSWTTKSKYGDSSNRNGYTAVYTQAISNIQIRPGEYFDIYIKFKMEPEAVKALISKQETLNNIFEISSFSTGNIDNGIWKAYAGIDEDSNPGSIKGIDVELTENYKKYDFNKDGLLNEEDVEMIRKVVMKVIETFEGADVDGDGSVTLRDMIWLRKLISGAISIDEVESQYTTTVKQNDRDYLLENKNIIKTLYEDDTDFAPSLVLGIEEDDPTRGLSGTVFEDTNAIYDDNSSHPGEERMGNGILESKDKNRVYNMKVDLLEADESNPGKPIYETDGNGNTVPKIATLYKISVEERGYVTTITEPATTYTDSKGEYIFKGVVPGRYLIRYTYDNKCYIIKPGVNYSFSTIDRGNNRQEEKLTVTNADTKELIDPINVRDYKSTIIVSDIMKTALNLGRKYSSQEERMGDLNWILSYDQNPNKDNYPSDSKSKKNDLDGLIRYSDAVDNIDEREEMDDLYFENYGSNFTVSANTAIFDVGIEYSEVKDKSTKTDYSDEFKTEIDINKDYQDEYGDDYEKMLVLENGRVKLKPTFYAVEPYLDFGIVERARQDFELQKTVTNMKILLASGQVLLDGNPYAGPLEEPLEEGKTLPYVKALPGMVVAEIDNEILQGATLSVEYTITIINRSEIDYRYKEDPRYYYYGTNPQERVITTIRKVVDYMEDDIDYDEVQNEVNWKKVEPEQLLKWRDDDNPTLEKQLIGNGETINGETYNVYDAIKSGYTVAVTEYFYNEGIPFGENRSVKIYGSKLLSTKEEGVTLKNHVEIIETEGIRAVINSIPGNYNPREEAPNEPDDDKTVLVITPPTGLKENKIFIISTIAITLVVLAGGVYIIKKKVLN